MTEQHFNSFSGNISPDRKNFNTSSYTYICSAITTSNVVETTTRGGILLQAV